MNEDEDYYLKEIKRLKVELKSAYIKKKKLKKQLSWKREDNPIISTIGFIIPYNDDYGEMYLLTDNMKKINKNIRRPAEFWDYDHTPWLFIYTVQRGKTHDDSIKKGYDVILNIIKMFKGVNKKDVFIYSLRDYRCRRCRKTTSYTERNGYRVCNNKSCGLFGIDINKKEFDIMTSIPNKMRAERIKLG